MQPLIIDGHLDLAMNALEWNRDLTQPLKAIRAREADLTDKPDRGRGVVSLDEMRRGRIGICLATSIARYSFPGHPQPGWHSPEIAWAIVQAQRAWYGMLEEQQRVRVLRTTTDLDDWAARWLSGAGSDAHPLGLVWSLEGADSIVTLSHLERLVDAGLRAIGPAHYGPGVYAPGTGSEGALTSRGRDLLREMQRLGLALDLTHLTDEAFWEALKRFDGVVWASHSNCRRLVPDQRQLNDEQIRAVAERGGVIGAALDAWMLVPGWKRGTTQPEDTGVCLRHVADHIDAVCQLLGNANHAAIGSDLDGGFGKEQAPLDLESIADLQKLDDILAARGYNEADRRSIFCGNWLRCLRHALPTE